MAARPARDRLRPPTEWSWTDGPGSLIKRAIDLAGAVVGLLLAPVMLALAPAARGARPISPLLPTTLRTWRLR
jgi:lipopolysaccharide/colanic/teichoic acid biosynthesis glycosyltransferase